MVSVHSPGNYLYALRDKQLGGLLTWRERNIGAVLLFTSSEKAEKYAADVYSEREFVVYMLPKDKRDWFVKDMIEAGVDYALLDLPPEHVDPFADESQVRNYAIIDLLKAAGKIFK